MNDAELKQAIGQVPMGNPHVIKLLETTLADARAGRVAGIAIIKGHAGQMTSAAAGALSADLYLGCDLIKDTIKQQLTQRGGNGILRPV